MIGQQDVPDPNDVDTVLTNNEEAMLTEQEEGGAENETTQVTNSLFPAPPFAFARFTRENIARYQALIKAREKDEQTAAFDWSQADPNERIIRQRQILQQAEEERLDRQAHIENSEEDVVDKDQDKERLEDISLLPAPTFDILLTMEPPRVDWIKEQGFYACFGQHWPVDESIPGLKEQGMPQLYPDAQSDAGPIDRQAVLTTLLRTMLKSYLGLIDVVLAPPHEYLATEQDPSTGQLIAQRWRFTSEDKARQINDLSINFMHLLNESRPLQAREHLRDLMRQQLDKRREEADLMKIQCKAMRQEIESIRERMQGEASQTT